MGSALYFVLFIIGLVLIIKGSDWFVDSAVWFAKAFRIPQIIIGATIISICTTLPETLVAVTAAVKGETDMAVGTTLGSIITNTGFILGIMLIFMSVVVDNKKEFAQNGAFLILSLIFIWIVGATSGELGFTAGIILIVLLILFILSNFLSARKLMKNVPEVDIEPDDEILYATEAEGIGPEGVRYDTEEEDIDISSKVIIRKIIFFFIGVAMVVIGANLLVDNGIAIAELLGVPTLLISIIFASLGTSLPELVTVITSMRKGAMNMGMGNIIGANVLNIVQALGISALFTPISFTDDPSVMTFQMPVALIICVFVLGCGILQRSGTKRWNGAVLIIMYVVFLIVNLMRGATPLLGPLIF